MPTIKKSIQLTSEPLDSLISKGKAVDFRLNEEAWGDLKVNDHIEFWEDFSGWDTQSSNESRKIIVEITSLIKAENFSVLIDKLSDNFTSENTKEEIINSLRKWWTPEKENSAGVLGIVVKVI